MPRERNSGSDRAAGDDGEKGGLIDRRSYLRLTGAATAAVASGAMVGNATAANRVDLGDEGLSEGDTIDPYLEEHFVSGNEVHVPEGEYRWEGTGLGGDYRNASLIGDGDVVFRIRDGLQYLENVFCHEGRVLVKNITVRGRGAGDKHRIRVDARASNASIVFDNVNLPDGAAQGKGIGFFVGKEHQGTATFRDCVVQGFPNNGLYGSSPGGSGGGGGVVNVIRGLYRNNNIANVRVGSSACTVRGVVSIHDDRATPYENGAVNQRGLWVRENGRDITIENCDVSHSYEGATAPILLAARDGGGSGTIRNTRVRNDTDSRAVHRKAGSWSGDDIHVTGSGDLSVPSDFTNVCRGSGCDTPRTAARSPDDDADSTESSGSGRPSEHTLELVSPGHLDYRFTTTGPIARVTTADGMSAEETNDSLTRNDDGTYTADGITGNGYGDTFVFDGELADFQISADSTSDCSVVLDNQDVTDELVGDAAPSPDVSGRLFELVSDEHFEYTFRVEGSVSRVTDYGRSSAEFTNDTIQDNGDGTVTVTGLTGNGYGDAYDVQGTIIDFESDAAVENRELYLDGEPVSVVDIARPSEIVFEGADDGEWATYEFEVTGEVVRSQGLGPAEEHDTVEGSQVSGAVQGGKDGFRFSGNVVSLTVNGDASVTIVDNS